MSQFERNSIGSPFNSPGMLRENVYASFSAIEILSANGRTLLLPDPGANMQYAIWGFVLDVSSASALEIQFENTASSAMFQGRSIANGSTYTGAKNIQYFVPLTPGVNSALYVRITGFASPGAVHCDAGVYYTPIVV